MIVMTEEQATETGQRVIDFLEVYPGTENLEIGEWITILATAIFMLGQRSKREGDERLQYKSS